MPIFNEASPTELAQAIALEMAKQLDQGYENAHNLQVTVPANTWVEVVGANHARAELEIQNIGANPCRLLREPVGTNPSDPRGEIGFYIKGNSLGEYHDEGATVYRGAVSAWSDGGTVLQVSEGYRGSTAPAGGTTGTTAGLASTVAAIPEFSTASVNTLTAADPAITITVPRFAGQTVDAQLLNAISGNLIWSGTYPIDVNGSTGDAGAYTSWTSVGAKPSDKVVMAFGPVGNQVRTPVITIG